MSKIIIKPIQDIAKQSYIEYGLSVIISRALADVRDGLKPVQRRIFFGMLEMGCDYNKPYRKSARVVGDVMGKYHPHGEVAIYDAMVRMAQDFSIRNVLIDGQGNFGSIDGDSPAAVRYTEVRLTRLAHFLMEDLYYDTVKFIPNYDSSTMEPEILPAMFPNILVNGAAGIAVGMATNIPTHNLGEIIELSCALIDDPDITYEQIIKIMPGPDFPTGGIITNVDGILSYYKTGRGSITIRGCAEIKGNVINITELPYQINKAKLVTKIAELAKEGVLVGISNIRDESDMAGMSIVIELKRDANASVVLSKLYKHTGLQSNFAANMLMLNNRIPGLMNIKDALSAFIESRQNIVISRTKFKLKKAKMQAHIMVGLMTAIFNIDRMIAIIKASKDVAEARKGLKDIAWIIDLSLQVLLNIDSCGSNIVDGHLKLTDEQTQHILDLKLQKLTNLEQNQIKDKLVSLFEEIKEYVRILSNINNINEIIKREMREIASLFPDPRRTKIEIQHDLLEIDCIENEEMIITVSHDGYIKSMPSKLYKTQKRGGRGKLIMNTKHDDHVRDMIIANSHDTLLFFSSLGKVYSILAYRLPSGTSHNKGELISNILAISSNEKIAAILPITNDTNMQVLFVTKKGKIKKNNVTEFVNIKTNGKRAILLAESDMLESIELCDDNDDIVIVTKKGKAMRCHATSVRTFVGLNSFGVTGINLDEDDEVVSTIVTHTDNKNEMICTITNNGYAKCTELDQYRITDKGAKGVIDIKLNTKNGIVVKSLLVKQNDELVLITQNGNVLKCLVQDINSTNRKSQGVIVLRTDDNDKVVTASVIGTDED